jgi:hypothetical protein
MNGYGKLRRCTDKRKTVVEFWLYLAAAFTVIRRLINQARSRYRWPTRLKVLIKLPVLPCHRSSLKRCLHATRGSPSRAAGC